MPHGFDTYPKKAGGRSHRDEAAHWVDANGNEVNEDGSPIAPPEAPAPPEPPPPPKRAPRKRAPRK